MVSGYACITSGFAINNRDTGTDFKWWQDYSAGRWLGGRRAI